MATLSVSCRSRDAKLRHVFRSLPAEGTYWAMARCDWKM